MAWDLNVVLLIGRLTRDPEIAQTRNNLPYCKFSIASNRGQSPEETSFFDIVVWRELATRCGQYLKKGSKIAIEGRLRQNRFTDKNNQNRSKVEITATSVQFLDTKEFSQQQSNNTTSQNNQQQQPLNSHTPSNNQQPFNNTPQNSNSIDFPELENEQNDDIPF